MLVACDWRLYSSTPATPSSSRDCPLEFSAKVIPCFMLSSYCSIGSSQTEQVKHLDQVSFLAFQCRDPRVSRSAIQLWIQRRHYASSVFQTLHELCPMDRDSKRCQQSVNPGPQPRVCLCAFKFIMKFFLPDFPSQGLNFHVLIKAYVLRVGT